MDQQVALYMLYLGCLQDLLGNLMGMNKKNSNFYKKYLSLENLTGICLFYLSSHSHNSSCSRIYENDLIWKCSISVLTELT